MFRPFDLYEQRLDKERQTWICKIRVSRRLFGGLIDNSIYKIDGDGYVTIPSALYPLTSYTNEKGIFKSNNPMYKAFLYPLFHNTHKSYSIDKDLKDFINVIVPEHLDRNNNLEINIIKCHEAIKGGLDKINSSINEGFLTNNLFFDKKQNRVIFYFIKKENGLILRGKNFDKIHK
jgi:hypothetical protein